MAFAQMSGQDPLPTDPYAWLHTATQRYAPAIPIVMPTLSAPARAVNALSLMYRAVTLPICSDTYVGHCKQGQTARTHPISGFGPIYCSPFASRVYGMESYFHDESRFPASGPCQGNGDSCVPLKTKCRVVSKPSEPLSVKDVIGSIPACPNRRISLNLEITGGAKNYTISIDNRIVSSNNIGFFSTKKNTSQSIRVYVSDSSSPRQTWSKTITLPSCRNVSRCAPFTSQSICEAAQCQWEMTFAPCPVGFQCASGGVCRDPDPQQPVACIATDTSCDIDSDCANTPITHFCQDIGPLAGNKKCTNGSSQCKRRCLAESTKIATPIGDVAVTSLKVGDIVWTTDAAGNRIVRPLIKVSRVPAPNHRVVHLVLADSRSLDVSALHPAAGGIMVGDLKAGDAYDGSVVQSAAVKAYEGTATYDILPAGETGYYWANGILMGSTLQ